MCTRLASTRLPITAVPMRSRAHRSLTARPTRGGGTRDFRRSGSPATPRRPSADGCQRRPERRIVCPRRLSGPTPRRSRQVPVRSRRRVSPSSRGIARTQVPGPMQSGPRLPMRSGCSTCSATPRSGWPAMRAHGWFAVARTVIFQPGSALSRGECRIRPGTSGTRTCRRAGGGYRTPRSSGSASCVKLATEQHGSTLATEQHGSTRMSNED